MPSGGVNIGFPVIKVPHEWPPLAAGDMPVLQNTPLVGNASVGL